MSEAARQQVRRQAGFCCEYCRIQESHLTFSAFHLDHVVARQHGGTDAAENLAWSCQECNLLKGTNLTGIDPDTGAVVDLFHPRRSQTGGRNRSLKREGRRRRAGLSSLNTTLCHLVTICRGLKRRLRWDPAKEQFVGDEEANKLLFRPRRKGYELPKV